MKGAKKKLFYKKEEYYFSKLLVNEKFGSIDVKDIQLRVKRPLAVVQRTRGKPTTMMGKYIVPFGSEKYMSTLLSHLNEYPIWCACVRTLSLPFWLCMRSSTHSYRPPSYICVSIHKRALAFSLYVEVALCSTFIVCCSFFSLFFCSATIFCFVLPTPFFLFETCSLKWFKWFLASCSAQFSTNIQKGKFVTRKSVRPFTAYTISYALYNSRHNRLRCTAEQSPIRFAAL